MDGNTGICLSSCTRAKDITGCRFSLAPMCDAFAPIILDAIKNTDTSKVYAKSGKLSTLYRGRRVCVVDATKACFIHAWREGVHMSGEFTFSRGCPGDVTGEAFLDASEDTVNESTVSAIHFPVLCKISFYSLGREDYFDHIMKVIQMAKDAGVYANSDHYVSVLSGDVHAIFAYFCAVLAYAEENLSHYVLEATLSVNSPTVGEVEA